MRLSFDDEESFKETVESLRFNNPSSDPGTQQQIENSDSMPLEDTRAERNEDRDDIAPSDPLAIPLRRVGSSRSLSTQETRRSADIPFSFNGPPSNPEFIGFSANGM